MARHIVADSRIQPDRRNRNIRHDETAVAIELIKREFALVFRAIGVVVDALAMHTPLAELADVIELSNGIQFGSNEPSKLPVMDAASAATLLLILFHILL